MSELPMYPPLPPRSPSSVVWCKSGKTLLETMQHPDNARARESALKPSEETRSHQDALSTKLWRDTIFTLSGRALRRIAPPYIVINVVTFIWTVAVSASDAVAKVTLSRVASGYSLVLSTIGFLLVFRLNRAAVRYWDARAMWGKLIEASRNLMGAAVVHCRHSPQLLDAMAAWTCAFAVASMHHLRGADPKIHPEELAGIVSAGRVAEINRYKHKPLFCAGIIRAVAAADLPSGTTVPDAFSPPVSASVPSFRRVGSRVFRSTEDPDVVAALTAAIHDANAIRTIHGDIDILVGCVGGLERIRATPLPFVYVAHLRTFLVAYLVFLPIVFLEAWGWWTIPVVAAVSFALLGIEGAAGECESPFDNGPNDLMMGAFCLAAIDNVREALLAMDIQERWVREDTASRPANPANSAEAAGGQRRKSDAQATKEASTPGAADEGAQGVAALRGLGSPLPVSVGPGQPHGRGGASSTAARSLFAAEAAAGPESDFGPESVSAIGSPARNGVGLRGFSAAVPEDVVVEVVGMEAVAGTAWGYGGADSRETSPDRRMRALPRTPDEGPGSSGEAGHIRGGAAASGQKPGSSGAPRGAELLLYAGAVGAIGVFAEPPHAAEGVGDSAAADERAEEDEEDYENGQSGGEGSPVAGRYPNALATGTQWAQSPSSAGGAAGRAAATNQQHESASPARGNGETGGAARAWERAGSPTPPALAGSRPPAVASPGEAAGAGEQVGGNDAALTPRLEDWRDKVDKLRRMRAEHRAPKSPARLPSSPQQQQRQQQQQQPSPQPSLKAAAAKSPLASAKKYAMVSPPRSPPPPPPAGGVGGRTPAAAAVHTSAAGGGATPQAAAAASGGSAAGRAATTGSGGGHFYAREEEEAGSNIILG